MFVKSTVAAKLSPAVSSWLCFKFESIESVLYLLSKFLCKKFSSGIFLPREAPTCVVQYCYGMSCVHPSVCPSITLVDCDHIQ